MHCSPPAKAPKSKLAIEQASTGGHWSPPKRDSPCPKTYMIVTQLVKSPPSAQETWVQSLGWEDPLEEEMVTTPIFLLGVVSALYSPRSLSVCIVVASLTQGWALQKCQFLPLPGAWGKG